MFHESIKKLVKILLSYKCTLSLGGACALTTEKLLETLDVKSLRKAGMFLKEPECRVYLSGFSEHHQVQLRRALKSAGAVSVNELTSSVTHVIVNQAVPVEQVKIIEMLHLKPHFVSLQWLVESMQMSMAVSESDFYVPFPNQKDSNLVTTVPLGDTIGPLPKSGNETVGLDNMKIVKDLEGVRQVLLLEIIEK